MFCQVLHVCPCFGAEKSDVPEDVRQSVLKLPSLAFCQLEFARGKSRRKQGSDPASFFLQPQYGKVYPVAVVP